MDLVGLSGTLRPIESFLGRDKELQDIQTFQKSDKQVLKISGVPMIGKSRQETSLAYLLFFVYLTALRKNVE
ncbi:MAG: hypothetical protein EAZ95_09645 [Bacteroidetes bacterium]|nr:MAG: hypothetical protein EAZ95_09645 [Bacteroidota bacterium]